MATYVVTISQDDQTEISVGDFLRQAGLSPAFADPDTRIPALIGVQGIVHYTRSGTRTAVSSEDYAMQRGDILTVLDSAPSGENREHMVITSRDVALTVHSDTFGTQAHRYMERRPGTTAITGTDAHSMESIIQALVSGANIATPINDVIIVSHANVGGALMFRFTSSVPADAGADDYRRSNYITYAALRAYIDDATRTQITDRTIRSDANIHIRGCNVGRATPFLELLQELFGGSVTVTAPKHVDSFGYIGGGAHRAEFMLRCFTLHTGTPPADRDALVELFRQDTEIDSVLSGQDWASWVSSTISNNGQTAYSCTIPGGVEMSVYAEYRHERHNGLYAYTVGGVATQPRDPSEPEETEEPEEEEEEEEEYVPTTLEVLREALDAEPDMQSSHPSPDYQQFSYRSLDDFVDGLDWNCTWDEGAQTLECVGSRHKYELRVPIVDSSNTLMANILIGGSGQMQYVHHGIVETDTDLFGIVSAAASPGIGESTGDSLLTDDPLGGDDLLGGDDPLGGDDVVPLE